MSRPNEYVRAKLIINDLPTASRKERINILTWLENQIEAIKEDNPKGFGKEHTARLIETD